MINFIRYTAKTVLDIHPIAQVFSRNWITIETTPSHQTSVLRVTGVFAKLMKNRNNSLLYQTIDTIETKEYNTLKISRVKSNE